MQITLKQTEVEIAIRDYVRKMGIVRNIENMGFTTTRQPPGVQVEIQLDEPKATHALGNIADSGVINISAASGMGILSHSLTNNTFTLRQPDVTPVVAVVPTETEEETTPVEAVAEEELEEDLEEVVVPVSRKRSTEKSLFA